MVERDVSAVADAVKDLFEDSRYADLTISCGERKWRVHKAVVCMRCEYLARNYEDLKPKGNTIELVNEYPNTVAAMLRFLYTNDFDDEIHLDDELEGFQQLAMNIGVYVVADKYQLDDLADLAKDKFSVRRSKAECNAPDFREAIRLTQAYGDDIAYDSWTLETFRDKLLERVMAERESLLDDEDFRVRYFDSIVRCSSSRKDCSARKEETTQKEGGMAGHGLPVPSS
ncbi:hypothetical protein CKM354_000891000 [Cercospora kikuchii]|uniref:BTB domain-containing protein n=1 Tax=Cercospora kikuchii TaxID=84275 RepID=A0A9P3CQL5_9PEZI|nr:uncharacterized protein CKM354_000891000 [Cercospora kikuchii]GIZ45757.1 hypothetical protein CKM354_000891000 [Cercospora kikuchii]